MIRNALFKHWQDLLSKCGLIDTNKDGHSMEGGVFTSIMNEYTSPRRFVQYPNLILRMIEEYKAAGGQDMAIEFAVWFINYSSRKKKVFKITEAVTAADKALELLKSDDGFRERVRQLLLCNEKQELVGCHILSDLNLLTLGTNLTEFASWRRDLRNEYPSMSNQWYSQFQCNYFDKLLKQESIFKTPYFRAKYEASARKNIVALLNEAGL